MIYRVRTGHYLIAMIGVALIIAAVIIMDIPGFYFRHYRTFNPEPVALANAIDGYMTENIFHYGKSDHGVTTCNHVVQHYRAWNSKYTLYINFWCTYKADASREQAASESAANGPAILHSEQIGDQWHITKGVWPENLPAFRQDFPAGLIP